MTTMTESAQATHRILVVIHEGSGNYWLLMGQVGVDQRDEWEAELRRMIDGFRITEAAK